MKSSQHVGIRYNPALSGGRQMELDDLRGPSENVIICCDTLSAVTEDGKKG